MKREKSTDWLTNQNDHPIKIGSKSMELSKSTKLMIYDIHHCTVIDNFG